MSQYQLRNEERTALFITCFITVFQRAARNKTRTAESFCTESIPTARDAKWKRELQNVIFMGKCL
jgi:hypothetical protein